MIRIETGGGDFQGGSVSERGAVRTRPEEEGQGPQEHEHAWAERKQSKHMVILLQQKDQTKVTLSTEWLTLESIEDSEYIHPGRGDVGDAGEAPGETQQAAEAQHRGAVLHQLVAPLSAHGPPAAATFSPEAAQLQHHQQQQAAVGQHHRAGNGHRAGVVEQLQLWEAAAQPAPEVKQAAVESEPQAGRQHTFRDKPQGRFTAVITHS